MQDSLGLQFLRMPCWRYIVATSDQSDCSITQVGIFHTLFTEVKHAGFNMKLGNHTDLQPVLNIESFEGTI